jgi:hypothetical protein
MGIETIWPLLSADTRDWLIANNGDAVPADIAAEIDEAVDASGSDEVWADPDDSVVLRPADETSDEDADIDDDEDDEDDEEDELEVGARYLADDVVDWIEEFANEGD